MYEYTIPVRYSECGRDGKLSIPALMDRLQDCAVYHTKSVGLEKEIESDSECVWIITSWDIVIDDIPEMFDEITTRTWAFDFKGFRGLRNMSVRLADSDRILVKVESNWAYIDRKAGKPVKVPQSEMDAYGLEERMPLGAPDLPKHILIPKELEACARTRRPVKVRSIQIDSNNHMNNVEYVRVAMGYLPEGFEVKRLRVDYSMQAKLGDVFTPVTYEGEGVFIVALNNKEGKHNALIEFMV